MNSERRIQRVRKAIEPPGEAKPDWEIICDLARAMGKGEFFAFNSPEEIWEEIRTVWKAGHGITYARLEKRRPAMAMPERRPSRHDDPAYAIHFPADRAPRCSGSNSDPTGGSDVAPSFPSCSRPAAFSTSSMPAR